MTPERMARLVARWVRFYTRGLPDTAARRRIEEIDADLHEHVAHERARQTGERRIAASIAGRMLRGLAADASWRAHTITRKELKMQRSFVRVGLVTALILGPLLVASLLSDGVDWGVFDFVFAAILLVGTGLLLELAAKRPGSIVLRIAAAAIGVACIVLGEADDAPGLVLFGGLLILGTIALAFAKPQRG